VNPAWVTAAIAFFTALGALLVWMLRWAWRIISRIIRFLDDYFGTPGHEGVPARPGVMSRLQSVEQTLATVAAETKPNNGTTLRDVLHDTRDDVSEVKNTVADLSKRVDSAIGAVEHLTTRVELFEQQRETREANNDE
jgi:hypothetical protein